MPNRRVANAVWMAVRIGLGTTPPLVYACGGATESGSTQSGNAQGAALPEDGGATESGSTESDDAQATPPEGGGAADSGSTQSVNAAAALPANCTLGPADTCHADKVYPLAGTDCLDFDASTANCEALCGATNCSIISSSGSSRPTVSSPSGWVLDCLGGGGTPCSASSGRRPAGLRPAAVRSASKETRKWLALAHLEAASVVAFERLAEELSAHGAPERLQARALRAADDEVRHARAMESLARRAGAPEARTPGVRLQAPGRRALERIARENAVEGCVRETFGAALAGVAAERAADARVRVTMRRIARDETRHAELAWDVARWAEKKLDPAARRRVERARARAVQRLGREVDRASASGGASERAAVFQALRASLWAASDRS
jgi:hypothetical protein